MSTESSSDQPPNSGLPHLTRLGKRIELRRIDRGITKRDLARLIGTSRQQLWRVMTGKSELTDALSARLADVLAVDPRWLRVDAASGADDIYPDDPGPVPHSRPSLAELISDREHLERVLAALPAGDEGRRIKRSLLDAIEDAAQEARLLLPAAFFDVRRDVLNGER